MLAGIHRLDSHSGVLVPVSLHTPRDMSGIFELRAMASSLVGAMVALRRPTRPWVARSSVHRRDVGAANAVRLAYVVTERMSEEMFVRAGKKIRDIVHGLPSASTASNLTQLSSLMRLHCSFRDEAHELSTSLAVERVRGRALEWCGHDRTLGLQGDILW